jgi:hypothetical protein
MFRIERVFQSSFGSLERIPVGIILLAASTLGTAQMPGQKAPGAPPAQIERTSHGVRATAGSEVLEVTVCSDSVIHVVATPEPSVRVRSCAIHPSEEPYA